MSEDDDVDLFRRAAAKVRRIQSDRVSHERRRPKPVPRGPESDAVHNTLPDSDLAASLGNNLQFGRSGVQKKVMRKLRRGQIQIEDELDLHGMRVHEASEALSTFLSECGGRGLRCVRIIHGKGMGSSGGRSVLKENVDRWLRLRDDVVAFSSAQPADGGTGAVYVLLKQ